MTLKSIFSSNQTTTSDIAIKKVNNELLSMFEFYKASFELSNNAKLAVAGDNIVNFNHAADQLLGITKKQSSQFDAFIKEKTLLQEIDGVKKYSMVLYSSEGIDLEVIASMTPTYVGGKLLTFIIIQDLTELLIAQRNKNLYMAALNESSFGIVITDVNGFFIWASKAIILSTGYPFEELVGQNASMLQSGLTSRTVYADMWDTLKKEKIWKGEFINKRKNGKTYVDRATIIPISREGKIVNYIAIKEDIKVNFSTLALEKEENINRLKSLFADADTGFMLVSESLNNEQLVLKYNIDYKNAEVAILFGKTNIIYLEDLFNEDYYKVFTEVLTSGRPTKFSFYLDNKGNFEFYVFRPVDNKLAILIRKLD